MSVARRVSELTPTDAFQMDFVSAESSWGPEAQLP